ncbi:uncharacterized protein CLUP02_14203 [Colletotrichum lupini]|uniref:Uncharacterized protein n=1 Tax=Colletotrichum lupini TaxID=145971 RepID=A0A9Q8T3V3_9PEZI|nr:uncharacterized protein CLUP02_14203 [Colletotrichum lupini]UQC88678.1 hypothetical protein CLUP02_14203 [Colletotrichum lupini]
MAKGKSTMRSPARGSGRKMVTADGLDHPISLELCKRLNRFYEALILLSSLMQACSRNGQQPNKAPSDVSEPGDDYRMTQECLMNKLAQICDNRRGGETITSVAIIQLPDCLVYAFASNQRSPKEIKEAETFLLDLFEYLSNTSATSSVLMEEATSKSATYVLEKILAFNHERVQCYRIGLVHGLTQCIKDCDRRGSVHEKTSQDDEALVRAAADLRQSLIYHSIVDRGKLGRFDESPHWAELQHFIGRLVSYLRATQTIFVARRRHPELFDIDSIKIKFIPSSRPLPNPMNAFQAGLDPLQRQTVRSAHDLIPRMTGDAEMIETYSQYADELQVCKLDELIATQCCKFNPRGFRPIVHSEVLLLDWLRKQFAEDMHSIPFYEGNKYIGCSKPTCRLCEYYFAAHSSGVRVRSPHRNVYRNWAVPDALVEGETSRYKDKMIDAVLVKVREDALTALREKVCVRKRFDSNTYSSMPTCQSLTGISVTLDDLSSRIGGLSISSHVHPRVYPSVATRIHVSSNVEDTCSVAAQGTNGGSDDESGGVLVFSGRNRRS